MKAEGVPQLGLVRGRIGPALVDAGLLDSRQLEAAIAGGRDSTTALGAYLVEEGLVSEDDWLSLLEREIRVKRVNLGRCRVDPGAAAMVPVAVARRLKVLPLACRDDALVLAMADPTDLEAIDEVSALTKRRVNPVLAGQRAINELLSRLHDLPRERAVPAAADAVEENSPVARTVEALIRGAVAEGASDLHLEPAAGEGLRLRMRLDGVLHDLTPPPGYSRDNLVSRIKIMAGLDIAEKRRPQDGNIQWRGGEGVSLRVSTLPTVHGEKVVLRILQGERIVLPLEGLGLSGVGQRSLMRLLLNRSGLILVTGPTGSGKTTTLYSALHYLNDAARNIVTVEDPVEYQLSGINQVQVNPRLERTFASALPAILRQDPDVIMVGEIRDPETARIAARAAITGHLVFSTLHSGSAAGAVFRLMEMGLERYMVTAALAGVVTQRLVRKLCARCRQAYVPTSAEQSFYEVFFSATLPPELWAGRGCRHCSGGYRGRGAILEVMPFGRTLKDLVARGGDAEKLEEAATAGGMVSLRACGLQAVGAGLTSPAEVVRVLFDGSEDGASPAGEGASFAEDLLRKG